MDFKQKYDLVTRNIEEILVEDELKKLLKLHEKVPPVAYCGYELSGPVHLGTWANIRKLIDFQKAGFKVKVLLADYHTWLNLKGNMSYIRDRAKYWEKTFVACGLSTKTEFILGSDFQKKNEYVNDLLKLSLNVTINRALRSMQGIARNIENAHVSQIIYPLMQIADMKHLKVDIALGGMEQRKIHVLAREVLKDPKKPRSGTGRDVVWRTPVCLHNELLISLQGPGTKMSSSKPETLIELHEDPKSIEKKIEKAFCPPKEVNGNPIIQIAKLHIFPAKGNLKIDTKFAGAKAFKTYSELISAYKKGDIHPQDLKKAVAKEIIDMLKSVRDYFKKNPKYLKSLK